MTTKIYAHGSAELAAVLALPGPRNVTVGPDGVLVATGDDYVASPAPHSVTPWQIRKALNATGLRTAVEAAVAAGPQDMKDGWEFASEVRRDDPLVAAMGAALGKSPEELDDLFLLATAL